MLASAEARALEERLRAAGHAGAAARGRVCWLSLAAGAEGLDELDGVLAQAGSGTVVAHLSAGLWPAVLAAREPAPAAGLLRADLPAARPLVALAVAELREWGVRARIAPRPPGRVAARRALAGVEPGGTASARAARLAAGLVGRAVRAGSGEAGQALPLAIGGVFAILVCALVLLAVGGGVTAAGRVQRAADLAALSGARSLRDDLPRLLAPERLPGGAPNPSHLSRGEYLDRASAAALDAAGRNGLDRSRVGLSFPDGGSLIPVRVRVEVSADLDPVPGAARVPVEAAAEAESAPPIGWDGMPTMAGGGGYQGPLAYRQGKPTRSLFTA
jgi:hypothetical protein